jgi:ribosomal protein S18 acetylase RimI-like enzyme
MDEKIIQRNFRKEDLPKIIEFRNKSFSISFPGRHFDEERFTKRLLKCAEKNPEWIQVLEKDGEILGYIWFGLKRKDKDVYGLIHHIFIDEAHRRKGFAKCLIEHAEKHLASLGIKKMRLHVTLTNTPALNLYEKMNYKKTRVIMEKEL